MRARFAFSRPKNFDIPVISIGNLTVGGSGKTPLVTALSRHFERPAVILRGYGRKSEGLHVVRDAHGIVCDVATSGDEAMIYAHKLPHAVVIVSEIREPAIMLAKEMGCEVCFLDDGYSKHQIAKLDILIDVATPNRFCLPSGPYRERHWKGKDALHVKENDTFTRVTSIVNPTEKMLLVTAIARPKRLDPYLPEVIGTRYFPDHYFFEAAELEKLLEDSGATSLLVTYKDYVKIAAFGLPLSLLELELDVADSLIDSVTNYVKK